jgi:dCTP deaminase
MRVGLIDKDLKELIKNNNLSAPNFDLNDFVQPASMDIPLGQKAFLVKQKFLPFRHDVKYIVNHVSLEEIDISNGANFLKGQTYLVKCLDIDLPNNLKIFITPKSSIGRIDLLVRSVFDNFGLYDTVYPNSKGELWLEISPQSFNVRVKSGLSLNQLKISKLDKERDCDLISQEIIFDKNQNSLKPEIFKQDHILLSLNVSPDALVGYEAVETNELIDLSKTYYLDRRIFFKKMKTNEKGKYTLEKDKFYIMMTNEFISIKPEFSAEMVPFFHLVGELRAHYAGFFDPGFGGDCGAVGVLEIRPHETLTVYHEQPICLMEFYWNTEIPKVCYGDAGNNYQMQEGPRLAKYFKKE